MPERIVITGMGTLNALGKSVPETWENVINGVSGLGPITLFDATGYLAQCACEVKDFQPQDYIEPREVRRRDRFEQFASAATLEALRQSGLQATEGNATRIGVLISSAIGGLNSLQEVILAIRAEGPRRASPFAIPMLMANGGAGMVGIDHGFKGPSMSVASACASGADSLGLAWLMLRAGVIDAALAGASEACITFTGIAAFDRLGAMTRQTSGVPQPFDKDRDGLVMGEGVAVLVLETESHARSRGAEILAELAGYASTADAYHVTAPSDTGAGGALAMRLALQAAGANAAEVGYINAHGTATQLNDLSETRAIKAAFGDLAYNIPISSTKSMTGHMMGATGALEAVFLVQAIREGVLPPTINYRTPDPQCDLDYVPNQARETPVRVAMSNSFGFGGHNAVLVVKKYE